MAKRKSRLRKTHPPTNHPSKRHRRGIEMRGPLTPITDPKILAISRTPCTIHNKLQQRQDGSPLLRWQLGGLGLIHIRPPAAVTSLPHLVCNLHRSSKHTRHQGSHASTHTLRTRRDHDPRGTNPDRSVKGCPKAPGRRHRKGMSPQQKLHP